MNYKLTKDGKTIGQLIITSVVDLCDEKTNEAMKKLWEESGDYKLIDFEHNNREDKFIPAHGIIVDHWGRIKDKKQ